MTNSLPGERPLMEPATCNIGSVSAASCWLDVCALDLSRKSVFLFAMAMTLHSYTVQSSCQFDNRTAKYVRIRSVEIHSIFILNLLV